MTIKSTLRSEQLTLLSDYPAIRRAALPILDQRLRGTTFVALAPRSILNSPQQTGVDFWSLNPYIGCEFGCTYCYARYAHRYAVERARDAGKLSEAEFHDFRGPHGWEAFERRIFVKRSEEHTSELQSPFLISYAVFCLKKKKKKGVNFYFLEFLYIEKIL